MPINKIIGPFGSELKNALIKITTEDGFGIITEDGEQIIQENDIVLEAGSGGNACCPPSLFDFVNEEETVITYNQDLINKHGRTPRVNAYYFNEVSGFYVGGIYTKIAFEGLPVQNIRINHGGVSTGFIKLV